MKKLISVLMSATVIISGAAGISAGAAENEEFEIYTMTTQETDEYGFTDYSFTDKNGYVIEEQNKEYFVPNENAVNKFSVIPESYDARENGFVTDIKYQGNSGNCWAFSTISALESDSVKKGIDTLENADYSEAHLAWFAHRSLTENKNDSTYGDGFNYSSPYLTGGNWLTATSALARWSGVANENDYPFHAEDLTLMTGYSEDCRYDTSSGAVINSAELMLDMDDTKQWIMDHGSVTAAIYYHDNYFNNTTSAFYFNGSGNINHQITIVGWDDNYSSENFSAVINPEKNGAWLCKNSWSENWGDNGYFWVSYYDTGITYFAGFSAKETNESSNNYTYNGTGYSTYFSNSAPVQTANVLKAKGCEKLKAVSIYTITEASDVTVMIYTNIKNNYFYPNQGTLALTMKTFIPREGYHTIELPEEIQLAPDSIFSVVVECVSQSGVSYIPFEYNSSSVSYSANEGESFVNIGRNATTWIDNTQRGWGNLFIQAFTEDGHTYTTKTTESTCTTAGSEKVCCTGCGKVISEKTFAKGEHTYGEWSEYTDDSNGNKTSTKTCTECGNTITRTDKPGRTVNMAEFFEIIFELISKMFSRK